MTASYELFNTLFIVTKVVYVSDLSTQAVELLYKNAEEDDRIIQDLTDTNDALQRGDPAAKSFVSKKGVQTDLEGEELQSMIKSLSQRDFDLPKKSTDSKQNSKVYQKLWENKIKRLEDDLKTYFRVEIDEDLLQIIQKDTKLCVLEPGEMEPQCCLLYPNLDFFKKNANFDKSVGPVGELRPMAGKGDSDYRTFQRHYSAPKGFDIKEKYQYAHENVSAIFT